MKKATIVLAILFVHLAVCACPVCERNQAKFMRGIVHGAGPESNWDYVSIVITGIIAILSLIYSVKWLIKPNENNANHIKYSIFS